MKRRGDFCSGKLRAADTHPQATARSPVLVPESPAFRTLFEAHAAFVWRALLRHGIRERDLEDACQEVFIVVHARLADFEGRSTLRTWIYGIAVRVALAFRRKAARRREELAPSPPELSAEAEQHELVAQRETLDLIARAVQDLGEEQREVFALYELEGMTMAEVASTLSIPENTALYRLYAARDEIRAALRKHERALRPLPALPAVRMTP